MSVILELGLQFSCSTLDKTCFLNGNMIQNIELSLIMGLVGLLLIIFLVCSPEFD